MGGVHLLQVASIALSLCTLVFVLMTDRGAHTRRRGHATGGALPMVNPLARWHAGGHVPRGASTFAKVGVLTQDTAVDPAVVLPLFSRQSMTRRHRWQYHTVNDTFRAAAGVQLTVSYNTRDCTQELACDEVHSGDAVHVHGYSQPFVVSLYGH